MVDSTKVGYQAVVKGIYSVSLQVSFVSLYRVRIAYAHTAHVSLVLLVLTDQRARTQTCSVIVGIIPTTYVPIIKHIPLSST